MFRGGGNEGLDRRQVMVNLQNQRRASLEEQGLSDDTYPEEMYSASDAQEYGGGIPSINGAETVASSYESFYNSFKRREMRKLKRKKVVSDVLKMAYFGMSLLLIAGFAVFMNGEKTKYSITAYSGRTSESKSATRQQVFPGDQLANYTGSRFTSLLEVLTPISGEESFRHVDTPQTKALTWLANEDPLQLPIPTTEAETLKLVQRYVPMTIWKYFSFQYF